MKPFRQLSRRARLHRFKILAQASLAAFGISDAQLKFVQYNEIIIYRVDAPGPGVSTDHRFIPNRYALRIHAIDDDVAVVSELAWLDALSHEAGLPVPTPVFTASCEMLASIITPGFPNGRLVSMLRWLDGQKLERRPLPVPRRLKWKALKKPNNCLLYARHL